MMNSDKFIDKVKVLNLKKGDVLVVRYQDYDSTSSLISRNVWGKQMKRELDILKEYFEKMDKLGVIFVPNTIDFEVIRLEEWFV